MGIRVSGRDVDSLARGAMFISSGGGGSTRLASLLTKAVLGEDDYVDLVSPDEFNGAVVLVGLIGAPEIDDERLPSGEDIVQAVSHLRHLVGDFDAIGSTEIGGSNALFPLVAAARLGLPVIDGDTMGRSFPAITQSSVFMAESGSEQYVVFADTINRFAVIPAGDKLFIKNMAIHMNRLFGGVSAVAIGPLYLPDQASMLIPNSYTRALEVGRILLETEGLQESFESLRESVECFFCCVGKVVRFIADEIHDPSVGRACFVEAWQMFEGTIRIDYQTEYLLLSQDGALIAQTPQTIAVIDAQTRQPLSPGELVYGIEVAVFAMEATQFWEDRNHRQHVDLQSFGYGQFVGMSDVNNLDGKE